MKYLRLIFEILIVILLVGTGAFITTTYATVTYNAGYGIGHHSGYQSGYADGKRYGYSQGYEDGTSQGQTSGYSNGYHDGYQLGINFNALACWIVQNHPIVNSLYLGLTCSAST